MSRREDKTTETDDIAMAAEPIQGCNTRPTGRKTPADKVLCSFLICGFIGIDGCKGCKWTVSHSPTSSDGNANQVVDESKHKVDSDPPHCLFREIDAANHIQEVIL